MTPQKMNICDICRRFKMVDVGGWMCDDCKPKPQKTEAELQEELITGFMALVDTAARREVEEAS